MPLIVIIAIRSSPNKTPFSMREGRLAVGRYNSYHIVQKRGCVKMYTSSFLCTKPRLSQATALLFPKVFVPLGIQKISL